MPGHKHCLLALFFFSAFFIGSRQEINAQYQPAFERLSTEDGLSENVIYAIHQDAKGYLWVGTWDGLNRYDGYTFKKFFHNPLDSLTLPGNTIHCIYEDPTGMLWIGTNGGLCRLDPATGKVSRIKRLDASPQYNVLRIEGVNDDEFMVQTANAVFIFNRNNQQATPVKFIKDNVQINAFVAPFSRDRNGHLYTCYSQQQGLSVFRFDPKQKMFQSLSTDFIQLPAEYAKAAAMHFCRDAKGQSWIASSYEKIMAFDPQGKPLNINNYPILREKYNVQCMYNDHDGNLWIGTEQGLLQYDPKADEIYHYTKGAAPGVKGLPVINCISRDRTGVLWTGTLNGLNKLLPAQKKFMHITAAHDPGLYNDFVLGLYAENNRLLRVHYIFSVKHFSRISFANDPRAVHYSKESYPASQYLDETLIDQSRCANKAAIQAFIAYATKNKNINIFLNPRLIADSAANIWFADFASFNCFVRDDKGHYSQRSIKQFTGEIYDMQLHGDCIWLATANEGLVCYYITDQQFRQYHADSSAKHSLPSNEVLCFLMQPDNNIWIGTKGGGLYYFDSKSQQFTCYSTAQGLCNNTIYCMVKDEQGMLWLGTSNGLSKFDPVQKKFRNYFRSDGLVNSEFNRYSAIRLNGYLFFGGLNGIDYFRPSEVIDVLKPSQVLVTDVKVFNKSIDATGPITLPHTDNYISFEFATADYRNPLVNNFAYKLEGVDKDWVHVEKRNFAGYPTLQPGSYKFLLKGANSDGIWNETPVVIAFTILTPWWRQWWFYILCVLIIAGVLYGLYSFRIRHLKRMMALRTKISQDLHDEVGATLTSISFLSEVAKQQSQTNNISTLDKIGEYARTMITEMNDIVWAINPANDKFDRIIDRMHNFASPLLATRNIRLIFDADDNIRNVSLSMQQRKNLYLVFKEAINNAAKYSDADRVEVRLNKINHSIHVEIADDGKGFDITGSIPGNGLGNMRNRVREIHGKFAISSMAGKGTRISAEIPITQNGG